MGEFASKGVAGAGLGTGIAGLALGVLNGGANMLNGGWGNGWNRGFGWGGNGFGFGNGYGWGGSGFGWGAFDMGVSEALAARDARIAQLESRAYSDESDLVLYKYIDTKFKELNDKLCAQEVYNATMNSGVGSIANQVAELRAALGNITQTVVPKSVICDTRSCGNVTVQ